MTSSMVEFQKQKQKMLYDIPYKINFSLKHYNTFFFGKYIITPIT